MSSVVIVVPCFNEERRLDVDGFVRVLSQPNAPSFLFVDYGSTDGTCLVIEDLAAQIGAHVSLLRLQENVGKGEAVRRGVLEADSTQPFAIGYWDADLSTPLAAISDFVQLLRRQPETIAVLGARVRLMGRAVERKPLRHYIGRVFATLASVAIGFPVYDTQCGAKLFRRTEKVIEVFREPFSSRWAFDVEILARLAESYGVDVGSRGVVIELPLQAWQDIDGSKVRPADLPRMLWDLVTILRRYS